MIKLSDEFKEKIKLGVTEVQVGAPLPWTLFDAEGRLLKRKGAMVENPAVLVSLAKLAMYRLGMEPVAERSPEERQKAPFFIIGEMMGRLTDMLRTIAAGQESNALTRLHALARDIQVMCGKDADAALAAIHLDREGKYVVRHLLHSALLVELVAYRLNYSPDDRHRIVCAALSANVGMLELQESLQHQGEVTQAQRQEINHHPEESVTLLRQAGVEDPLWLEIVLQHHECVDGSGYPRGLKGDALHQAARLIALADIYHAKISGRLYRAAMLPTHALRQVFLGQGNKIDQELAKVFIKEVGVYPPGTFVTLMNGDLAVVTHRGQDGISPKVASLITPRSTAYPRPVPRDTSLKEFSIRETAVRDATILVTDLLPLWGY